MEGHALRACTQPSRYVVCEAEGRTSDHRLGSVSCKMDKKQSPGLSLDPLLRRVGGLAII